MDVILTLSQEEVDALTADFSTPQRDEDVESFEDRLIDLIRHSVLRPCVDRQTTYARASSIAQILTMPVSALPTLGAALTSLSASQMVK